MKTLNKKLAALPPGRRRKIARRTKELTAEEMTTREPHKDQTHATKSPRDYSKAKGRWKDEITRTFKAAADDLRGVTKQDIVDEIKRYRAERKKTPKAL